MPSPQCRCGSKQRQEFPTFLAWFGCIKVTFQRNRFAIKCCKTQAGDDIVGAVAAAATVRVVGYRPQRLCREAVGGIGFWHGRGRCGRCGRLRPGVVWRGVEVMSMVTARAHPSPETDVYADLARTGPLGATFPPTPEGHPANSWTWPPDHPPPLRGRPEGPGRFPSTSSAPSVRSMMVSAPASGRGSG
jgi:hypothetical protein